MTTMNTTTMTTETVKIEDCKLGDILLLKQGLFKICVFFSSIDGKEYGMGKDWIDSNGNCHPSGICFCECDELVERVIA